MEVFRPAVSQWSFSVGKAAGVWRYTTDLYVVRLGASTAVSVFLQYVCMTDRYCTTSVLPLYFTFIASTLVPHSFLPLYFS